MSDRRIRTALVTGASIAGPTLAYWLSKYGFEVTVVERAASIRSGGYAIDIRGTAIDVVARMGLLPALRLADVATRRVTFVDANGHQVAAINPADFGQSAPGRHVELARGALTSLLFELTRAQARYRFDDRIVALNDTPNGVMVRFNSGSIERFDIVLCCEGLHSTTREMVFGPEKRFSRYLGYCFAVFEAVNDYGLRREAVIFNQPGRGVALYSTSDGPMLYAMFLFRRPPPTREEMRDPARQRESIVQAFRGDGWQLPRILAAMQVADDFYFDATMQIRMPRWSKGRVALVGDAAYAPSFFTGQGTSIGLVGAYLLAGALSKSDSLKLAFRTYEKMARPYVTANQALVNGWSNALAPRTAAGLWARNAFLRVVPLLKHFATPGGNMRRAYEALVLPDF